MEQPSSSSKVTVEYHDPFDVYPLLGPSLLPRLPLRNLHWESHAGPLRSINSLHIDLVSSDAPSPLNSPSATDLSRVRSSDSRNSRNSGNDGFQTQSFGGSAERERPESRPGTGKPSRKQRHQIPGLRQTPYLKILLLRCDDNDTYKSTARKQVKEWIKENTHARESNSKASASENHDAFEWLILHVIVPNTAAATQPRTSGKSDESSITSEKSGIRWMGGGSTTILEKLRNDFNSSPYNSSSKNAVDRIAQIRIGINDVPYDMLPRVVPAIPGSYSETPQENENAWNDFMAKVKSQILLSFDGRVTQYEEDIREKDAQRSLPGWNFCTFFVLKEGLARGFESVGLVEDALVGYDELSIGLDAIIGEQIAGTPTTTGSFLPYTQDLKELAEQTLHRIQSDAGADASDSEEPINLQPGEKTDEIEDEIPLNASKKRYRELILSNDISIFDFRCYVFARQLSLLLRLGNAWSSREELLAKLREQRETSLRGVAARQPLQKPEEDSENLTMLAQVCRRALEFMSTIAVILRQDLRAGFMPPHKKGEQRKQLGEETETPEMTQTINNMVMSFTFAIAQQILAQTSTKSLPIPPSTLAPVDSKSMTHEPKSAIPEPKTMMHPARSSSLVLGTIPERSPSPSVFPGRRASVATTNPSNPFLKNGLEELAAYRADLYLLSRSILERLGKAYGWGAGWDETVKEVMKGEEEMKDVDLNSDETEVKEQSPDVSSYPPSLHGIESKLLRTALEDKENFYRLYETLTDKALRHYTVANRTQSVQTNMADLAVLKFHLQDYAAAASYFYRMTPHYGDGGWEEVEMAMLVMYAKCLEALERKDEHVRVLLKLLAKSAVAQQALIQSKAGLKFRAPIAGAQLDQETHGYLKSLVETSMALSQEIVVPMQNWFDTAEIEGPPQYADGRDGFSLPIRLRYLLCDELEVEKVKVKMIPAFGRQGKEIWLDNDEPVTCQRGYITFDVKSNLVIPGTYVVENITLQASNVTLRYDTDVSQGPSNINDGFLKCPRLLLYHRADAFDVRLFASRYMHLDRNRSLELQLSSGWNDVMFGELHVRPGTAGLRLQTSELEVVTGTLDVKKSEGSVIHFGAFKPGSSAKIRMSFNLEREVNDVALRLEVIYTTSNGTYTFATNPSISTLLPLGVNVQDVFKHKALFSKFTVSSSTTSPLRLLSSELQSSDTVEAESGGQLNGSVVVFPRQPASLLYKIKRRTELAPDADNVILAMSLVLRYICLEEEIDNAIDHALGTALRETPFYQYRRLIVPTVLAQLEKRISYIDSERVALLNEISTSIIANVNWRDCFSGLGRDVGSNEYRAQQIASWLQTWLSQTTTIPLLPITQEVIDHSRFIIIPVEVPSVSVVYTADLVLDPVMKERDFATLNEPVSASLNIKWTRIWDMPRSSPGTRRPSQPLSPLPPDKDQDLDFVYEISAPSDTWLVGGRRKAYFRVPAIHPNQPPPAPVTLKFPIILIPLREGYLNLPHLDIKPSTVQKVDEHGKPESVERKKVSCEVDYKNIAETIRCIGNLGRVSVGLDNVAGGGSGWVVECERRQEEV